MNIEEDITDEAKLFVLDLFIEQNQDAITSLTQTKYQWHFFGSFIRVQYSIDEKECNRLAILAAHLHANYKVTKSKLVIHFVKDTLIDFAYEKLKADKVLDSILDTAIPVHVYLAKNGEPITLQ